MTGRTPHVPAGDPSEPGAAIAVTPEAHALINHAGIPGVGGGAQSLSGVLGIGNTTGGTAITGASSTLQLDTVLQTTSTEVVAAVNEVLNAGPLMAQVFS